MALFRPQFESYKSPKEFKEEQALEAQQTEQRHKEDQHSSRRRAYGLVIANLPLLEECVEKSPVEVTYSSRFKSMFYRGPVGGWPVGSENIAGKDRYLVVTEDRHFGYAFSDEERNAFRLFKPPSLEEDNFITYSITHNPASSAGIAYVPPPRNIKETLQELLSGTGVEPKL